MSMVQPQQGEFEPKIEDKTVRPFGLRDKFGYLFGDLGNDFFFMLVSSYLMVFYTDIFGISAAVVGVLFMVARLWDAVADVTWGRFIDTRKTTPNGKFKPWIFRMSFPLVITGVLMFVKIPGMSDGFYMAWAFVTYIIWGTLYSTVNIPYGSMASVITSDPVERSTLSTWRTVGSMIAKLIISAGAPLLLFVGNEPDANRFFLGAIAFGILALACYMACYKLSTERVIMPERKQEKADLGKTVKGLVKNKPLVAILAASLLIMMTSMLIGAVNVYLFKDYFQNTAAMAMFGIIQSVAVFVLAPFIKTLTAKFGKKEIAAVGTALAAVVYMTLYLLPDLSATAFIAIVSLALLGYGVFNIVVWAFVTDVIDYHEYLTGLREDGTVYSIYSFARKLGQAFAGGLGGFAIGAIGYTAANKVQSEDVLQGIHTLATLAPSILFAIIFLILVFLYPLGKNRVNELAKSLAEKRKVN
jgi:glycoside/pentoside/hexuronide:cation symporter, GPH family